jgi:hypothetical protein
MDGGACSCTRARMKTSLAVRPCGTAGAVDAAEARDGISDLIRIRDT